MKNTTEHESRKETRSLLRGRYVLAFVTFQTLWSLSRWLFYTVISSAYCFSYAKRTSPLQCHVISVACGQYPMACGLGDMTSWLAPQRLMKPHKWRSINLGASYRVTHLYVLFQHVSLPSPNESHRVYRENTTKWKWGFVISTWFVHFIYTKNKSRNYPAIYIKLNNCRKQRVWLKQIMTKRHCTSYLNVDQENSSSVDLLDYLRFSSRKMTQSCSTKFCVISGGQSDKFSTIIYLCNEQHAAKQFRKQTRNSVFKIVKNSEQIAIKSSFIYILW